MQRMNTAGLIVVKDGVVQVERYAQLPCRRPWVSLSVKICGQYAGGRGDKDGFIRSADDPVTDYLPRLKGGVYRCERRPVVADVLWRRLERGLHRPECRRSGCASRRHCTICYMNQLPCR